MERQRRLDPPRPQTRSQPYDGAIDADHERLDLAERGRKSFDQRREDFADSLSVAGGRVGPR